MKRDWIDVTLEERLEQWHRERWWRRAGVALEWFFSLVVVAVICWALVNPFL